jgi:hypothetical protein
MFTTPARRHRHDGTTGGGNVSFETLRGAQVKSPVFGAMSRIPGDARIAPTNSVGNIQSTIPYKYMGTEVPRKHGNEVPHKHGNEVSHKHGNEVPHKHGNEVPHKHGNEVSHKHGNEVPRKFVGTVFPQR